MNEPKRPLLQLRALLCLVVLAFPLGLATASEVKATRPAPTGWELGGDLENGKLIYKQYCQKCHGKRGDGQGTMAKDLEIKPQNFTDTEVMLARTDWDIYLGVKEGGKSVGLSEQMTAWEDTLTEDEMHDVAAFVRQFAQTKEKGGES